VIAAGLLLAGSATALAADPAAGEKIFKAQCGICHAVAAGQNRIGPTLFGVVGRPAGSVPRLQLHRRPQEARHHLGRRRPRQIPGQSACDGAGHVDGLRPA